MEIKYFNTKSDVIFNTTDLIEWFLSNIKETIERDIEEFAQIDFGWMLRCILNLKSNIKKLQPMKAASYIELPPFIKNKQACVNVENKDNKCFMWAILSALHPVNYK